MTTLSLLAHGRTSRHGLLVAIVGGAMGIIYGYDTGNISGALPLISKEWGLGTSETSTLTTSVVVGFIVGALIASKLSDKIGRIKTLMIVSVGYIVFAILSGIASGIIWLDITRALLGVSIGISIVTTPVFLGESAPAAVRGAVIAIFQLAVVAGIMAGYFVDYGLSPSNSWRIMLALSAVPAAILLLFLLRLPDTPRWYMLKGRRQEAHATLAAADPSADTDEVLDRISDDLKSARGGHLMEMVRSPYAIATLFVVILGLLDQFTGINAITYYGPEIFKKMGFTGYFSTLVLPGFVEVASLFATFGALLIIDRLGRRKTLLIGITTMILANALMVALFEVGLSGGGLSYAGFVGILFFTAGFNFGFGTVIFVFASESFPARLRTIGASTLLIADLVGNLIIAQVFLTELNVLGGAGVFAIFLVLAVISWGWVAWLAPETKGRQLEKIRTYWENGRTWPDEAPASAASAAEDDTGTTGTPPGQAA